MTQVGDMIIIVDKVVNAILAIRNVTVKKSLSAIFIQTLCEGLKRLRELSRVYL
jgi:hypothetical protein